MTHVVSHLSFGSQKALLLGRKLRKRLPGDLGGIFALDAAKEVEFISQHDHVIHEHYLKVRIEL